MDNIRLLNFDDLFLLRFLLNGYSLTAAAKELKLTQPALTQRVRKIEAVFNIKMFVRAGRNVSLTKEGLLICKKATDALIVMSGQAESEKELIINIGTRPEAGRSWLWPALTSVRKKSPLITFHVSFGSGSELLAQLGIGRLDAVLTSAPLTTRQFEAIELVEEPYVLVAHPKDAVRIKRFEDLKEFTLIEHDRSFPFMGYVDATQKPLLQYRDVWFLESTEIMADAISKGFGIGIIPDYIAQRYLKKKQLMKVKLPLRLGSDHFRLVFRNDRHMRPYLQPLADELIAMGLI